MYTEEIKPYLNKYYETLNKSELRNLIEYSTNDGKCIRGFIVKHIIETLTSSDDIKEIPWQPIVGVELIHSASIIIDDLPSMDNETYRRNKLSTFNSFGINQTILSSYFIISETIKNIIDGIYQNKINYNDKDNDSLCIIKTIVFEFCELLGKNLVIGQFLDLKGDIESYFGIKLDKSECVNYYIIKYKTCSLFSFCFLLGAIFSIKLNTEFINDFKDMGLYFGMMFQIMDDYKDRHTDIPYSNYILINGLEKSVEKYQDSRDKLCLLLQKHNLYTDRFKNLILNIDNLFNI
jgi:geranylgeranyl diphosphate synthase type II